jgi:DNA (cytosine-5)-methyltransferase 1
VRVGSCFAGIGGFDLGLERAGFGIAWQIELQEYSRSILAKHWPSVPRFHDIRTAKYLPQVDLICGGFPCQDISLAGQGIGIDGNRSGLWTELHRLVLEGRPRWVLVENVAALRTRGADRVLTDLAEAGYKCWPLVVGAWAVGAGHRRERVWIVGYSHGERRPPGTPVPVQTGRRSAQFASDLADAGLTGRPRDGLGGVLDPIGPALGDHPVRRDREVEHPTGPGLERRRDRFVGWPARPTEPQHGWEPPRTVKRALGGGAYGLPRRLAERRRKREIEALGNAVVPQIAEALGRMIIRFEQRVANDKFNMAIDLARLFA